eukprot:2517143-Alexandrium_andersonii.AAC.1
MPPHMSNMGDAQQCRGKPTATALPLCCNRPCKAAPANQQESPDCTADTACGGCRLKEPRWPPARTARYL